MATGKTGAAGSANPEPTPIKRQAIVVVHGQGEQRPMGTIRDFVKVLWQFNANLMPQKGAGADKDGQNIWIVPDSKSGLYELQRITTPPHNGRKTDFFELYYADLLNENSLRNLWRWLRRLLWIDPTEVPDDVRAPWTLFWVFSLVAIVLFWTAVLSVSQLIHTNWIAVALEPRALPGLILGGGALAVLLVPKFFRGAGWLNKVPPFAIVVAVTLSIMWVYLNYPVAWVINLLVVEFYVALRLLLPYFGDAASYLSAQTQTVQSRQSVRNRGLRLLRALHDDPAYDRVVVIGHSLGSVLAYDLLHILWREGGPTKDNPPADASALLAVDAFVAGADKHGWQAGDVERYQGLQWAAFNQLRCQRGAAQQDGAGTCPAGWKVSDFIALGSPLASAQFLITQDRADFERMKRERVLPTAPAQPYDRENLAVYTDAKGQKVAHHGAVFSVVRWANIFDPFDEALFLLGDPISGPVSGPDRFGNGVLDRPVKIRRPGVWGRFFTHSLYWIETSADWVRPAHHIKTLRQAVGIDRQI
ncbi:MAG: hypothetical protein GXP01_00315 [Alphaproteobacteria bacterium]|nr:hypothetical protein [Alphaproteobacteria bacterium]